MSTPTFLVSDVLNRAGDWVGNYSTGQTTTDTKVRAVDFAVNFLKRTLGLPQDEVKSTFSYVANNFFYDAPSDFADVIGLFYNSTNKNIPIYGQKWEYRPYQEIMGQTGRFPANPNMWSITTTNGATQLMLLGNNTQAGGILDPLSAVNAWKVKNGASNLAVDSNNFPSNFGLTGSSLKFTAASYATNHTASMYNQNIIYSIPNLVASDGTIQFYTMMSSNAVTSITLTLRTDSSDYYTFTATSDVDGNAFEASTFQRISFPGASAVITGSPSSLNLTYAQIDFNLASGYTGGTFWVNTLYDIFPDTMNLIYYSKNKGTDASGNTITQFTSTTDQLYYDYDFIEPLALIAAGYLMPSLRGDVNYRQMYKMEVMDMIRNYSRQHPRIRTRNDRTRTRLSR